VPLFLLLFTQWYYVININIQLLENNWYNLFFQEL
jgi:hypothetical protein